MKHKIKKWHIALMSFLALFIAVIGSLFSLRAVNVENEEIDEEELVDDWSLDVVFYDSSKDNGLTPLKEINWDASDGGYGAGDPRVITVQINYKNANITRSYNPGELTITIPNLIYGTTTNTWTPNGTVTTYTGADGKCMQTTITVGANDSTHTNYAWDFRAATAPTTKQELFVFTNTNTIEAKSNFEGTLQIVYEIQIIADTPEKFLDECIKEYSKELQATLSESKVITSPNWPEKYPNNMTEEENYWEYTYDGANQIQVTFDKTSQTQHYVYDPINIYDKNGNKVHCLGGSDFATSTYLVDGDYVKLTMKTNNSSNYKGFMAFVSPVNGLSITTDPITFNYTRTCIHPWQKPDLRFFKTAAKLTSMDGLPSGANNYIWVKYGFFCDEKTTSYPYIGMEKETALVYDTFPAGCLVYTTKGAQIQPEADGTTYIIGDQGGSYRYIFVGYPRSVFNEQAGNLNIINTADYYGYYDNMPTQLDFIKTSEVSINLAEFEFSYSGSLYSIEKACGYEWYPSSDVHKLKYQSIINNWADNVEDWNIKANAIYTGTPMTVKIGDDLLYALNSNNQYVQLKDNEYYFTKITLSNFNNGQGTKIPTGKYNCELWVRYANNSNYILYESFTNGNGGTSRNSSYVEWAFPADQQVCGFYFVIHDMVESINNGSITAYTKFKKTDIGTSGFLYNFAYIATYFKDSNGNLTIQNEPTINNYTNMLTQEEIASFDQQTYGHYLQRDQSMVAWYYYNVPALTNTVSSFKLSNAITQDSENEEFTSSFRIGTSIQMSPKALEANYFNQYTSVSFVDGFKMYDLLPEGMTLTSTKEDLINTLDIFCSSTSSIVTGYKDKSAFIKGKVYDTTGKEISPQEFYEIVKNNIEINIIENWNNTNRTKLEVIVDLTNNPLAFTGGDSDRVSTGIVMDYNYSISYDAFIEYGNVYINYCLAEFINPSTSKTIGAHYHNKSFTTTIKDNGQNDIQLSDINENGITDENISSSKSTITITSVVSSHQDVTTYVKTDQSNYSTGIVDTSNASEYEYKLRVRTSTADVTNLVIYSSIEEAQPNKSRWKGEFLDIDTTHAENKGYTVKVWYSPNTTVDVLSKDSSWKEYTNSVNKNDVKSLAFQYLDNNGNPAVLPANTLTYVLIKMKAPADANIRTLARMDCWTRWNAVDEFGDIVDFITGINSNVVKVALPNSVKTDDMPSIALRFTKEITGTDEAFKNMNLNKADTQVFKIRLTSLTANDDGSYNYITAILNSNQELIISQIPVGTYLLEELSDNYFDFVDFTDNNDPEIIINGVTFERTDQGYIITVSEDLAETVEFNIKVTNEIEPERFYEDKNNKENLFLINNTNSGGNENEEQ